jgi:hypothetical protein
VSDRIEIKGDAIGSAVGAGARVRARDISVYKQTVDQSSNIDDELKRLLKEARDAIELAELGEADKADATEDLGKLTAELEKAEKDPGLVGRYFNRIKEVVPTVARLISSAKTVADLLGYRMS